MAATMLVSVSSLMEDLDRLEAQGYGDALLELCALIPLVTRKLVLPVVALRDRLEKLEGQGYGESLLELRSITFDWGKVRLQPGEDLSQVTAKAYQQPATQSHRRKTVGFHVARWFRHWLGQSEPTPDRLPQPIEVEQPSPMHSPSQNDTPVER